MLHQLLVLYSVNGLLKPGVTGVWTDFVTCHAWYRFCQKTSQSRDSLAALSHAIFFRKSVSSGTKIYIAQSHILLAKLPSMNMKKNQDINKIKCTFYFMISIVITLGHRYLTR